MVTLKCSLREHSLAEAGGSSNDRAGGPVVAFGISRWNGTTAFVGTPVLPEAAFVGALSALLHQRRSCWLEERWITDDPLLPFNTGPVNGRKARESGLPLKTSIAPSAAALGTWR